MNDDERARFTGGKKSSSKINALDPETARRLNNEAFTAAAIGSNASEEEKAAFQQTLENPTSPVQAPNLTTSNSQKGKKIKLRPFSKAKLRELRKNENADNHSDIQAINFGNEVADSLKEVATEQAEEAKDKKEDDAAKDRIFRDEERDRYGKLEDQEKKPKKKSKEEKQKEKEENTIHDLIMDVLGKVGTVLLPFVAPFAIANLKKLPELIFNGLPNLISSISSGIDTAVEFAGDLLNITKENIIPKINFIDATITFRIAVNIITFFSFILLPPLPAIRRHEGSPKKHQCQAPALNGFLSRL